MLKKGEQNKTTKKKKKKKDTLAVKVVRQSVGSCRAARIGLGGDGGFFFKKKKRLRFFLRFFVFC